MNEIVRKGNIISRIRKAQDLNDILAYARQKLYQEGPVDTVVLEILSYLKLFQPDFFAQYEMDIIETMGLFFKDPEVNTLQSVV